MSNESSSAAASLVAASAVPRGVEAGRGASWWSEAWRLFVPSVGSWLLIVVILLVLQICLQFIPVVGHLANSVLFPVLVGGLMLGCRAVDSGQPLSINHLFAGFTAHARPLLILGALYAALLVASVLITAGIMFVSFGGVIVAQLFSLQSQAAVGRALGQLLTAILVGALLFLALTLPLIMAVWFAPALVVFRGAEPWAAMKLSFSGCLKNAVPFLVYGLIGVLLAVVASVPLLLGWFVLLPVAIASVYTSYCDIFEDKSVS